MRIDNWPKNEEQKTNKQHRQVLGLQHIDMARSARVYETTIFYLVRSFPFVSKTFSGNSAPAPTRITAKGFERQTGPTSTVFYNIYRASSFESESGPTFT